jgi:hypothetical protein
MIGTHRCRTAAVLIVCLLATASSEILFASDDATSSSPSSSSSPRANSSSPSADITTSPKEDVSTVSVAALPSAEQLPGTNEFARSVMDHSPLRLSNTTLAARSLAIAPDKSSLFAQRGGYRGGRSGRRNSGAAAALFAGAAAAIAGTAVLVYANRPECTAIPTASGCGYGTKVVGGAVLSAGIVGVMVGALTWR